MEAMTTPTTQPVDLAEARNIADCIELMTMGAMEQDSVNTIRSLADEVEALRQDKAFWEGRVDELLAKFEALDDELTALKAVGPDGLPPLPDAWYEGITEKHFELAMTRYARAAIAATQQPKEPMTRFCPGCGSVGKVDEKYRDCCPDGSRARVIPESLANHCHDLFQLALTAPAVSVDEVTEFKKWWDTTAAEHGVAGIKDAAYKAWKARAVLALAQKGGE